MKLSVVINIFESELLISLPISSKAFPISVYGIVIHAVAQAKNLGDILNSFPPCPPDLVYQPNSPHLQRS